MMRAVMIVIAVSSWFGLILQLSLLIAEARATGMLVALVIFNYFSFFTILTNVLVAVGLTCTLWMSNSRPGRFFTNATVQSASAVYIVIVGAVYALALRHLWNPQGLQKIADVVLHELVPLLYGAYWLVFVARRSLAWKSVLPWLLSPLAYLIFVTIRGAISGWYPYPFINAGALGYARATLNAFGLFIVFIAVGLIAVAFSRWMGRNYSREIQPAE